MFADFFETFETFKISLPVWRALPNITLKSGCSDYTEQTEKLRIQTLEDNNLVEK